MKGNVKNISFVIRTTPFNTIVLAEALRMAVGLTMHDNRINILFIGDGVWNALKLSPHIVGRPDIYESMELFSACGVRVFADEVSLMERDISEYESHVEKISREDSYDLIANCDVVMSFR